MRSASLAIVVPGLLSACVVVTEPSYARVAPVAAEASVQAASDKYGPEPGESLLQFGGAISGQNRVPGNDNTSVSLQGGIGWFQSEWLEIGGQVLTDWTLGDGPDTVIFSVAPYVNGNYKVNPRLWLYAGPHLGLAYLDFQSDDAVAIEYGLHGGTRYWVDPRTSVFGELRYTHAEFDIAGFDLNSDTLQLLFGFSVVF